MLDFVVVKPRQRSNSRESSEEESSETGFSERNYKN